MGSMQFWGIEVKPGESVKCDPGEDKYLHLSQAALGEQKKDKGSETIQVFLKVNDKKLVLGTLATEKWPQIQCDLIFEKEFELSHTSKNTSVHFHGYKTLIEQDEYFSGSDSDEEFPLAFDAANGKVDVEDHEKKPSAVKANSKGEKSKSKTEEAKVKTEEANKAAKPKADEDDDDSDDDDDDSDEDDSASDDEMISAGIDSDDDDVDEDDSSDEDDATPKKVESGKRPHGSASKTPVPEKKAKLLTPAGSQKTGGDSKKSVHTATPYPSKQGGKTPANSDKSKTKPQTPKSGGSIACKSCSKMFNSDGALQSHTKAKHATATATATAK